MKNDLSSCSANLSEALSNLSNCMSNASYTTNIDTCTVKSGLATSTGQSGIYYTDRTNNISINAPSVTDGLKQLHEDAIKNLTGKNKEKENKNMFNFDFGKITTDTVRMSMYGPAVKSVDGRYVAYDKASRSVMDVDLVNMSAGDFLYKMPVAITDIKEGDMIIHNRVPMYVTAAHHESTGTLHVIDVREATEKEIYPIKSPFGFNYITKVVSLIDFTSASADQPFGNMLPFLLMDKDSDMSDVLPFLFMSGSKMDMSNPMLMLALCGKNFDIKSMLPFLLMTSQK